MTKFRGGGQIGRTISSWPFVALDISDDEIRLSIVLEEVTLKKENIVKVEFKKGLLASKIIFKHSNPLLKINIQFWTFSPDSVMNEIRARGYPTA